MKKTLAITATISALALSACAPAPAPVTDQEYKGGKASHSQSASYSAATRFRGCPDWAPTMYRGDLYCLKNYPY